MNFTKRLNQWIILGFVLVTMSLMFLFFDFVKNQPCSAVEDVQPVIEKSPMINISQVMENVSTRIEKKIEELEAKIESSQTPPKEDNFRAGSVPEYKETHKFQPLYKTIHTVYGLWSQEKEPRDMSKLNQWKEKNPGWPLIIHSKQDAENLIQQDFAWLESWYRKSTNIQRADILRLLFVYKYGGIYTDVDVEPHAGVEEALNKAGFDHEKHNLAAFIEHQMPREHIIGRDWPIRNGISEINVRISNYVFYASKESPALMSVILNVIARLQRWQTMSESQQNSARERDDDYITIYTTGPDAFTESVYGGPELTPLNGVLICNDNVSGSFSNHAHGSWRGRQSEQSQNNN